jgi:hypothetical protein
VSVHGGMAEWTIAAVLKTAEPKAPGVRIPLPPLYDRVYAQPEARSVTYVSGIGYGIIHRGMGLSLDCYKA